MDIIVAHSRCCSLCALKEDEDDHLQQPRDAEPGPPPAPLPAAATEATPGPPTGVPPPEPTKAAVRAFVRSRCPCLVDAPTVGGERQDCIKGAIEALQTQYITLTQAEVHKWLAGERKPCKVLLKDSPVPP